MRARHLAMFLAVVGVISTIGVAKADHMIASVAIDRVATLSVDRVNISVSGRYTLGPLAPGEFIVFAESFVQVKQAAGQQVATGTINFAPIYDGLEHTFQFDIAASNVPWHGGPARGYATVQLVTCGGSECESANASVSVPLQLRH